MRVVKKPKPISKEHFNLYMAEVVKNVRRDPPSAAEIRKILDETTHEERLAHFEKRIFQIVMRERLRSIYVPLLTLVPRKTKLADAILLFVCKPDDAEVAAGDLFEELEKVQSRHGSWYCNIWFSWELAMLVVAKGRARFTKSVFGPVLDLLKRKSG